MMQPLFAAPDLDNEIENQNNFSDGLTVTPGFISALRNQITVSHHFSQVAFNG